MTRRLVAAAVLGAAAGYLARSQLARRVRLRRALQPHGRLLRDAALIAAQMQPGERYESLSVAVRGDDGRRSEWCKRRSDYKAWSWSPDDIPDDLSKLDGAP